jgi:putative ABC transport system permease protein
VRALERKLLRDLWHLRGQVVAVALVVTCAIASFVTMRAAYVALVGAQASYYARCRFADVFARVRRAPEAAAERLRVIPGVAAVETRIVEDVTLDVPGLADPATGRLVSIPAGGRAVLNAVHLRAGRFPEAGRAGEVVASEAFAAANGLVPGSALAAVVNGRREVLTLVGVGISPEYVYEIRPGEIYPDARRFGVLWMERATLAGLFDLEGAFNDVAAALAPAASEADVLAGFDAVLGRWGGLGAYGRGEHLSHRFVSDEIAQDRVSGLYVPAIFLGIAGFLIHTVLSRLVGTQREQIAVLKAFGYTDGAVGAHYLGFALAAVLSGAAAGSALGMLFARYLAGVYARFFRFPAMDFTASPGLIALAVAISAAAAGLGALGAVRRAVRIPPAEAMRPEPPPQFRRGLLERAGLARLLSPPARMILRNVARRRAKAALSALGIALAVAMLVLTRFFVDVVDLMAAIQFTDAQREDVTVLFNDLRPAGVLAELRHIPGVLAAEPFRAVPARLVAGHRSRRVEVTGVVPGADLRRIVAIDRRAAALPPEGLLVTGALADLLGVRPGDAIDVEVLDGRRPVLRSVVSGTVEELIGLAAYMDLAALDRLLGGAPAVSGAYLAVDPAQRLAVSERLKRTPAVAGVAVRESMVASFYATIAESMTASTTVLVSFACVIAVAIVYNGARISLSERGHELASLRVLGFTRAEIGVILLGEQALLTAAALPLGMGIGWGLAVLLARSVASDLYRFPVAMTGATFAFAALVTVAAALGSGALVARRVRGLDLVAVLKTRE